MKVRSLPCFLALILAAVALVFGIVACDPLSQAVPSATPTVAPTATPSPAPVITTTPDPAASPSPAVTLAPGTTATPVPTSPAPGTTATPSTAPTATPAGSSTPAPGATATPSPAPGATVSPTSAPTPVPTATPPAGSLVVPAATPGFTLDIQAETASLTGTSLASTLSGWTGTGYVTGFDTAGDRADFTLWVATAGTYQVSVRTRIASGPKTNDLYLGATLAGQFIQTTLDTWETLDVASVALAAGANTLSIRNNWGWFQLDKITLTMPDLSGYLAVNTQAINSGANSGVERVYRYLKDNYGTKVISGQMDLTWDDGKSMVDRVYADSGKYPALQGFDFMNIAQSSWGGGGSKQTTEALAWWDNAKSTGKHGLVAFCWHWRVPLSSGGTSSSTDNFYVYNASSRSDGTTFVIPMNADGTLKTTGTDYATLKAGMDLVAAQLQTLEDAGVPVLWRPLHEASGGWFWWGAARSDGISPATAYKALWNHLYTYLAVTKGLDNLIWVCNAQDAAWYPGDATTDIVGEDIYAGARDYGSQVDRFVKAAGYPTGSKKIVALTENGVLPDPDLMFRDQAWWSWFMVWNDGSVGTGWPATTGSDSGNFWTGEYWNTNAHKAAVYAHSKVITLDELPDLTTY